MRKYLIPEKPSLNELYHHGVKGMKWGVRKDNKQSAFKTLTQNLDKFGKNGHNILYVTGGSGSGKSTLALQLSKKYNAEVIHLDHFYDNKSNENSSFNDFLKKNNVDRTKIFKDGKVDYSVSDKIYPLLKEYSKNKKIIAEGVQLLDQTMAENMQDILKNEPLIRLNTSERIAKNRREERDRTK